MKNLYVIYDNVSRETLQVFIANNDSSALRTFNQSIPASVNKDDFSLYLVAKIDMEVPQVLQIESSVCISIDNTPIDIPDNPAPVVEGSIESPTLSPDMLKAFESFLRNGGKN